MRIARLLAMPRPAQFNQNQWEEIQAALVDEEVAAIETGIAYSQANPRLARNVGPLQEVLAPVRGRFLHTYTVRIKLMDRINGDERWVTITVNAAMPEGTDRFKNMLEKYLHDDAFAEQREEDEGYLSPYEDLRSYHVMRRDNINVARNVVNLAAVPGFSSELTVMNVVGQVRPAVAEFERMCGFLLIQEDLSLSPEAVEELLARPRTEGLTAENMIVVFQSQDRALIIADTQGVEVARHSLPQGRASADRKPTVYVLGNAHWMRPTEQFADRVRRARSCDAIAIAEEKKTSECKRDIAVIAVESMPDALAREEEFKQDIRLSPLQFKAELARRRAELSAWTKANGVSFTGRRRALQPQADIDRWDATKAEQREQLKAWIAANEPRRRDNPAPRRIYYIRGVNDLTPIWTAEVAQKRLYDRTKIKGMVMKQFALTPNATLTTDDDMEDRRSTFTHLWKDATFTGQSWATIGGAYLRECFNGQKMPVSSPNVLTKRCLGGGSCGGIYFGGGRAPTDWTVHAVDVKRQYAAILRAGGFYTIDIGNEMRPMAGHGDLLSEYDGNVRTDRIWYVEPMLGTCLRMVMGRGLVDYELMSACFEYFKMDINAIYPFIIGYIPVNAAPEADELYRKFVDRVYEQVPMDAARKRLVNFAVGLMVNNGARSRQYVYHTDDKTTAHFYFNTMNAPLSNKRLTSMSEYVNRDGMRVPVYTVKGITESKSLTTQILANRAIVQRGRAQMVRAMSRVEGAGAHVISIKVDSITYATEGTEPIFDTPTDPALGEWRKCPPVFDVKVSRIKMRGMAWVDDARDLADECDLKRAVIDLRSELKMSEGWCHADKATPTITPYEIIGDLRLPKKAMTPDEFAAAKRAYTERLWGGHLFPESVIEWERAEILASGKELPECYIPFEDTLERPQDPKQYRAFIAGLSGTGKSHTANALSNELKHRGFRVFRSAYTYCAAELVDGQTLHATLGMSINGDCTSSRINHILANYDAGIVDEISMVDLKVWRVLSCLPRDFPLYLFGDFGQLKPIDKTFWARDSQALRSICGNRRFTLTKQWRSDPAFVGEVLKHARKMNRRKNIKCEVRARATLPPQIKDGSTLTMEEQATMLHIFARNAPRKATNCAIVEHLAAERKDAVIIPFTKRRIEGDYDFIEYPDMNQLAAAYHASTIPDERHALNAYLSRARLYGKKIKRWGVAVKYKESTCGRFFTVGRIGIQSMSRAIRARTCRNYLDIDFKNSGATILRQAMMRYGIPCPALDNYCENREDTLTALLDTPAIAYKNAYRILTRDSAKEAIICLINGGDVKHDSQILRDIAEDIQCLWRALRSTPAYVSWLTETIAANMARDGMTPKKSERYLANCRTEWKLNDHRRKYSLDYCLETNAQMGAYVARVIYMIEARMLTAMVGAIKHKRNSTVLCFDGAMFEGLTAADINIEAVEAHIFKQTGYSINLAIKPIHDGTPLPAVETFTGHNPAPCVREDCRCLRINYDEFPAVFVGMPVLMITTRKLDNEQKLTNNSKHLITAASNDGVELTCERKGTKALLSLEELAKWARPAYCRTDYKVQGMTHDGGVVLHQYFEKAKGKYLLSENSRYTTMTRARDPSRVYVV